MQTYSEEKTVTDVCYHNLF